MRVGFLLLKSETVSWLRREPQRRELPRNALGRAADDTQSGS